MITTAQLNLAALHAASHAVSTDQIRYWLDGVRVEVGRRETVYGATDGHILFAYRDLVDEGPDNTLTGAWIIPAAVIKARGFKRGQSPRATLAAMFKNLEVKSVPYRLHTSTRSPCFRRAFDIRRA